METTNAKVSILHLITAAKNASPFDVNMAYDAGFDKIMPYTNVSLDEIMALTQDAMFSRSPSGVKREAIFIGGRDMDVAMHMLARATSAMFAPFQCSVFADPSGAFTTAAAMIAKVEHHLKSHFQVSLANQHVCVFGATGPVGACAAIIAAKQGAKVHLVAHHNMANFEAKAAGWMAEYGIELHVDDGCSDATKEIAIQQADIILSAAAAGVQVLNTAHVSHAMQLKIAADVNAVAPEGIAGIGLQDDGMQMTSQKKAIGIGALAIGQLKYQTQHQLLKQMLHHPTPLSLDFMAAFTLAQSLVALN